MLHLDCWDFAPSGLLSFVHINCTRNVNYTNVSTRSSVLPGDATRSQANDFVAEANVKGTWWIQQAFSFLIVYSQRADTVRV